MTKKQRVNIHHISYPDDPRGEITVKVFQGEHWAITIMERRKKNMSVGYLRCLQEYIDKHKDNAVDLDNNGI